MARKLSITKVGKIKIGTYDISVNGDKVEESIIKDLLGIEEYEDAITFYGKYTLVIEEQEEVNDIVNTFEKVGQKVTKEEV